MISFGHLVDDTSLCVVLETSHVKKMFLKFALLLTVEVSLGDACGAGCGAAAAFRKEEHTISALSFNFSLI